MQYLQRLSSILAILVICFQSSASTDVSLDEFDKKLDALRQEKMIPGMSVAVVKDNQLLWSKGYGHADSNREIAVTPETPFWIASVTKTFVGLAFLHLEANGQISFDELAAETPEFDGLCQWLAGTTIPFAEGLDCSEPIRIKHILHHQVNKPVGEAFMYNPIMYSRLSRYLEHKLGEGVRAVEGRHNFLAQTIDRTIIIPAGMTRSMASMWDRSRALVYFDLADGFKVDEQGYKTKMSRPDKHIPGGAGVVSTVHDLAKYDIAISTGKITPGKIKHKLMSPATFNNGSDAPYGYGWYFQCYQGHRLMWHSGWDPDHGYSAMLLRLPEKNLTFILLTNSEGVWWGNPIDQARIQDSPFAQLFFEAFVKQDQSDPSCAAG
ncbi:MAG: serine hydrolase domain-containing protein [Aliiglaciecola sp.]